MDSIIWTEATEPQNTTLADVIYNIRREDPENLLMDSVMPGDILADADEVLMLDALVVPYQQLTRRMTIMRRLMNRVGTKLKVQEDTDEMKGMIVSEPFKKNGAAQIAVTFNLDDGQTISVFFHNPDATPAKIAPSDDLISWKWLLNKKDVTIAVAPEHGKDLDVHEVARRVMKLADKNSPAFARANAKKAERLKTIAEQGTEIETLEKQLAEAKAAFEAMEADAELQAKRRADADAKFLAAEKRVADLTKERDDLKAKREAEAAAKKAAEEKAAAEAAKKDPEPKLVADEPKEISAEAPAQTAVQTEKKPGDSNNWAEIEAKLNQIIDKTYPEMGESRTCDWLVELIERYENDAEKYPKIEKAMLSMQSFAVECSRKALNSLEG